MLNAREFANSIQCTTCNDFGIRLFHTSLQLSSDLIKTHEMNNYGV